jgi:hypothetical protein
MHTYAISMTADGGGGSAKLVIAAANTSYQSVASYTASASGGDILITPDVTVFFRFGTNPTATSDGTDRILLAGNTYRIQFGGTGKFAFNSPAGTGNVYLSQLA